MNHRKNGRLLEYVLVDLNTQADFFDRGGACPVLASDELQRHLRSVVAWAKRYSIPVLSSLDSHRSIDAQDCCPAKHCLEGSQGQQKLSFTLFPHRVFVQGDNTIGVPIDLFKRFQQVIFPQRTNDLFANPKADRFLTQLRTEQFVLFGAVIERSLKSLALGLLARGKSVVIVVDACGSWNRSESDLALRQMQAKGATMITVDQLLARTLPRRWRYTSGGLVSYHRANGNGPSNSNGGGNGRTIRITKSNPEG